MDQNALQQESPGRLIQFMQWLMPKITPGHVWLYRKLNGRFVNRATGGAPVVLVTTRGRRTGLDRTVALGHLRDGDDVIVAGTNGGLAALPGWIHNIRVNPEVEVQVGKDRYLAKAEFLTGEAWQHHWQQFTEAYPAYNDAQKWAGRKIPLVLLRKNE